MVQPRIRPLNDAVEVIADSAVFGGERAFVEDLTEVLAQGATALRSAAWLTKDDSLVVSAQGRQKGWFVNKPISQLKSSALNSSSCTFNALLAASKESTSFYLGVASQDVFDALLDQAKAHDVESRIVFVSNDLSHLTSWRPQTKARLVNSVRLRDLKRGPERFGADVGERGIDGAEMHHSDWNGGLVTLFHRFSLVGYATGAEQHREMANLIDSGIDGILTHEVSRLVETASLFGMPQNR